MLTLSDIYQSFIAAVMRFFDNRFHPKRNEVADVIRFELDRANSEKKRLLDIISNLNAPKKIENEIEDKTDYKPIQGIVPWHVKKAQLEADSRKRAKELADEAKTAMNLKTSSKVLATVEDVEKELSEVNSAS